MFRRFFRSLCLLFCLVISAQAATGDLFVVTSTGNGDNVSITLCLNIHGNNPLSCQNYITRAGVLNINTTVPNKTYKYAGIRVNSPGYKYSSPSEANGYAYIGVTGDRATETASGVLGPLGSTLSVSVSPGSASVDFGNSTTFTATAAGGAGPYAYQWYSCQDSGCSSPSLLNNEINSTYSSSTSLTVGTYYYQVTVTDANSGTATSSAVALTVNSGFSVSISPISASVAPGNTATFTASAAGGVGSYTYQWYSCQNSGCSSLLLLVGATNSTYSTSASLVPGTYYYVVKAIDGNSVTATSNAATLTIAVSLGQSYGGGTVACLGGAPYSNLIAATTDNSTGIRWSNGSNILISANLSNDGFTNTNNIVLAQGPTVTSYAAGLCQQYAGGGYNDWFLPAIDQLNCLYNNKDVIGNFNNSSYWSSTEANQNFARLVNFLNGSQASVNKTNSAVRVRCVRVLTTGGALSISVAPSSVNVSLGNSATFTATAVNGTRPYTYQWYSCVDSGCTSPVLINGATTITYVTSTSLTTGTYYYKVIVTDTSSLTASSNIVSLRVGLTVSVAPGSANVTSGNSTTFTATAAGGTGSITYQWYSCQDSGCVVPTLINGATSSTYVTSTSLAVGAYYYYQAVVTDANSNVANSNVVTLIVNPVLSTFTTNNGVPSATGDGFNLLWATTPYLRYSNLNSSPGCASATFDSSTNINGIYGNAGQTNTSWNPTGGSASIINKCVALCNGTPLSVGTTCTNFIYNSGN